MNTMGSMRLNLATRPLRNTRFFRAAVIALAAPLAALALAAGFFSVKYALAGGRARTEVSRLEARISAARAETSRFQTSATAAAKANKEQVDLVNAVIMRKTFSWTGLLSELEAALPEASYVTSLAPSFTGQSAVELRIKVVSRDLADLLAFVDRLTERKFTRIRVTGESVDEQGRVVSEISFSYEKAL